MHLNSLLMSFKKTLRLLDYKRQISPATGSGHLPRHHPFHNTIAVNIRLHTGFGTKLSVNRRMNHAGEHGCLCIERGLIGGKSWKIFPKNGCPVLIGRLRQSHRLLPDNIFTIGHTTTCPSGFHRLTRLQGRSLQMPHS